MSLSVDVGRDLPLIVGVESGTPAADAGLQVKSAEGRGEDGRGLKIAPPELFEPVLIAWGLGRRASLRFSQSTVVAWTNGK